MIALINRIFIATIQILCNWVTKLSSFANSYKSFSLSNCLAASGAALPQQDNKVSKRHIGLFFAWWLGWAFVTACGLGVASNAYAVQAEDGTNHFAYISSGYCRFGSSHSNSIYGNANKFGRLGYDGATSDNGRGYQEGIKDFFSSNGNHRSWVAGIFKDTDGYCWVCEYDSDQNEYWNVYEATDIRYADACVNVIKQTVTSFSTEAVRKIYPSRALSESRFLSIPGARSINVNVSEMSSLYSGESIQILDQIGNVLEPQRSYDWDTGDENFTVLDDTIIVRFSSGENDSGIYDGNGNVKISKNVIPEAVGPMTLSASSNDQDLTWKITDSSGTTIAEGNSSYEGDDWSGYNYIEETIDLPIDISYIFTINSGGDCCYTFDLKDAEGTVIASGKKLGSNESAMFDISSTVLIINGYPTRTVYETLDYSFTPQVFGSNGSSLTFSIKNKPTWATFNSSTGALTGTPTSGDVGETSGIEITVSNDNGTATLAAFDITVLPPVAGMSPVYFYFWEGSADWKIIDSSGTIVAQGDLDSDSIELLVGTYTLTVDSCDYCEYSIEDDEANGLAWGDDDGSVLFKITSIFITGSPATTIYENQAYNFTPKVLNNSDNSLTFSIKNKPTWAPFDSNTGALTGTPTNSDIGTTSAIEITVSNGIETATLAAFDITVAVNTPPTFTSTAITSVDEDSTYTYEITTNDVDVGNNLTITAETKPTWLTFTDNGDTTATLTDTPTNSEVGSYNVTLRVNDGTEDVDQSFTIVVANVNDPPVITQGASTSVAISKNNTPTAFSLTLDATDIDPTSDTITWNISDPANYGTANVTGTGTPKAITYTPNPNNTTSDSFIVQVSDSNGGTDTITVNVTFTNEPPVITEGITKTVTMSEDDNLNFTLNTTDPNGINEMLTWSISSAASNGTASASGTGVSKSINYNPDANYNGSDSFVVEVSDGSLTDTITVKVTIEPANDSPSITEGPTVSVTILEDSTPSEILNATDIDNDNNLLSWNISTQANHGTASASGTGASKSISYNPAADYNGSDSFVVEVSDGSLTDTITINVTITNVNDPPVITQGVSTSVTISKNNIPTAFSLTLDATDIDPTNDTITWSISNPASRGTANVSGIGATKAITYTSTNVNDMTSDSFDVQVSDGNGATDTITVNVTFTNAPPVITEGDAKTIAISEDSNPIPFSLTLNATDPNGTNDTLSWSISSVASNGAASLIDNGASTIVNYIPTLNFIGEDNFEVKVTDTSGATDTFAVTVNVNEPNSINTPPVASDGSFTINEDGGSLTNLLIATDADGNSLTYSKVSDPSHGTVTISNATGSFTYTPTTDFNGSDSFKFKVNDGTVDSNIATVTISVTPIADMPTITPATTNEDIQTTSGLKISRHVDDGIEVTHFKITHIQYGTLYKNDGTTIIKINNGDFITVAEGNAGLKFTPIPDASTDGSFDVQSSKTDDDNGLGGNIATATITVSSVNDKPSFTASNPPPITEDAGAQSVTNWISSFNPGPSNESDQTVDSYIVESVSDSSLFSADAGPAIDSSGTLTYTPATNAFGTSTFTVKVKDNGGTTDDSGIDNGGIDTSDSQTFTITINTIADVPSVTTGTTTNEDIQSSDLVIIAASGDTDVSHFKITNIVGGKLYKNDGSTAINNSNFITKDEGNAGLKFTPALNSITGGSFGIQSSTTNNDSGLGGNVITATITVNPINDKPSFTASNPPPITEDAGAQSVTWISSFNPGPSNESDQTVDSYIIESVSDSSLFSADAGPTIDSSGTLTYTPAANAFGTSTFTVKVKDNGGTTDDSGIDNGGIDTSDAQTFTITVNTIADVPSVTTGTTTNEDTQSSDLVITAASGDTNVTHFKITNIVGGTLYKNDGTTAISNGNFITEAEGNAGLKFTPALNSITAGSFGIQASIANNDSGLGGSVMTANITVNPVNDKPSFTASNPPAVIEDAGAQTVTGWISSFNRGPSNESGQAVFAYIIDNVSNSDLFSAGPAIDNSGNLTYTPAPNAFGTSTFEVKVQDDGGTDNGGVDTSDFQRFTITVNTVADVPSVTNATTNEDTQSDTGLVITNNGDTDVTYFKITNIVGGILYKNDGNTAISNGNFISEAEGNAGLKFTPALNSIAGGSFGVQSSTANDNRSLGGNVITANITVNPVNDKPTFTASNPPAVNEDAEVQTISNWITSFNTGPSNENSQAVSDYLIANISNPDLFAIAPDVDNSGTLTYTVAANTFGVSDFRVKVKDDGGTANSGIDTSDAQTFTITVNTIADVPSVTNATTNEDTQSDSGLVITDNGDTSVTHFKITNIVGGILYQNDGSTAINNGDFITEAEGNAGLKFTPATDANIGGSFDVQSSLADDNNGLGGNTITATITVNPVNDQPNFTASNPPAITEDAGAQTVTGWISSFNPGPANESGQIVSTYIINNISNASLFSGGPIIDNSGNLTYTPVSDAFGSSTFDVKVQDNGGTANGGIDTSDAQTFTITLNTMADVPNVTNATTNEDTQSNSGLVITDNGDIDVTHFKITNIVGGTLYKNDGSTAINNGDFITEASGNAGLKFTPATDANLGGSFGIQSSVTNDNSGLGGNVVTATISVNPVNDIPSFTASNPSMIVENAGPQTITGWITSFNQGGNESNQVVNAYIVTNVNAPTLFSAAPSVDNFGNLTYTPATNTSGSSTFEVKVQDTGGTANGGVDTSIAKIFTITVTPKSVITPEPVTTPEPVITPEPVTTSPTGVSATSETGILQFALTTYFASERDGELQTITVTRTEKSKGNVSIQYFASANGTAISEVDYIGGIGTLTWANGDIQPKVLPLTILVDDETESLETVNLTLFNPTGHATLGSLAQTTLIIVDDDTYVPENSPTAVNSTTTATSNAGTLQFSAPFYSAIEDIGIVTTLNVIRTGGSEGEVSVQYTILDNGTAAFNFDYIGGAGKLIWVDGDSSAKSIVVMLLDDQQLEDVKTIPLILTEPTGGASLGVPDRATLVVVDNDGQPEVPPQVESEFTPSPEEPTSDSSLDKGKVTISPSPDESEDDSEYTNTSSLPSLGRGIAVAKDGDMLNAKVLEDMTGITIAFRGGASVGGSQAYHSNITTTPSHKVKIRGEIDIANTHIGQKADILVLVGVLDDVSGTVQFLMLDKAQLQVWDGGFATLVGSEVVLSKTQKLKIYHGFIEPVHVQIYFGYRLQKNGSIYFNGEQPIELQVGSEDDSSQDQKNQQVVWHTEFSPNGEQIVIASSTGHVSLWDANSGHRLAKFTAHTEKVKSAVFSADSKWLVTSSHDKTARLWNIETKQEVMVFSGHERALEYATFSPNAQRILTVSADKTARLWDTNNGETLFILEGHNQGVQYATFSHDGKRIVTASWDHTARLWDAETGEEIARLAGHANMVERAVFSPNDQYIITASWDKTARLWDAHTGQEILALAGHRNGVAYAAFSPDAEYIVTTSWDNTVRLWSARNGKSLWVREHQAGVHHAAFSPNSQIIVTGSNDGTARLWESATGRPIKTLKGHEGNVWQVGFSPDGKQVISASWDNTVRVWEVETGNIVMVLKD